MLIGILWLSFGEGRIKGNYDLKSSSLRDCTYIHIDWSGNNVFDLKLE